MMVMAKLNRCRVRAAVGTLVPLSLYVGNVSPAGFNGVILNGVQGGIP